MAFSRPNTTIPDAIAAGYRSRGLWTDARIGLNITRGAEQWGDWDALVYEGRRWSYRSLWRWVTAIAHDLVAMGVGPGDRLVWQLSNKVEALVLHLAAWRIGALCVPVIPIYREHEMAHILRDADPTAVAFSTERGSRNVAREMDVLLRELDVNPRCRIAVGEPEDGWHPLTAEPSLSATIDERGLPDPAHHDDPCLLLYTSGTTAKPKGALHSSVTLMAEATTLRSAMGFSYRDVFIMGAPITHIAGLLLTAIIPPVCGARSVLLPAWDPDVAVRLADAEHGTFSCGATVFLQAYVERYEREDTPTHHLQAFMCGGAAIPPSLIARADAVGIRAFRSWGLTEVPTVGLVGPDASLELRSQRDGRVSEGTEVHAIDESGAVLPPGEQGELRVRAPERMLGYTDPERNAELMSDDGWFRTGDVGVVDADGWITMTGRIKDIVNRGGEKFSAQDIENAIADHPAIASVAVIGAPDERLGETVVAYVTLRPGMTWPGDDALIDHLETKRLAKQKRPTAWRVIDELPATLSGKTQKHVLLALWDRGLADAPSV